MDNVMRHGRLLLFILVTMVLILPGAAAAQDSEPSSQEPELVAHDSEPASSEGAEPTVELQSGEEAVADEVLVKFNEETSEAAKEDTRSDEGLEKKEDLNLIDAEVDKIEEGRSVEEAIDALEARPEVKDAEPNHILKADGYSDEPRFASKELWGLHN